MKGLVEQRGLRSIFIRDWRYQAGIGGFVIYVAYSKIYFIRATVQISNYVWDMILGLTGAQPNLQFISINAIIWICINDINPCNGAMEWGYCQN